MGHYKSNVRDLEFNLFEVFDVERILDTGAFGDLDGGTVRTMLVEASRLAEGPVAEAFADADQHPPTFDPDRHSVTLPQSLINSTLAWRDAGWTQIGANENVGGVPAPSLVTRAINEFVLGAQPAAAMYLSGVPFADILYSLGNEEQRRWAAIAAERNWGATMVLTEPDAGSDVGAARTKATEQADGTWQIEGLKRFITSADSGDLFENIFHLVLARPVGAEPGTKGLSLFFVPKFLFDPETGEIGERNGVFVTNIEHKMGLRGSATCDLAFSATGVPAKGWLVGDVHGGIKQMFQVIESARMMVSTKAIATLSTGYLNALEYAKERVQGADLVLMADRTAPRVTIIHHPDVRRSLMTQKAYAEGLRAVYLYTAAHQDSESAQIVSGVDPQLAHRIDDLLLPVVKGVGSERAYQVLTESLQTFGGAGYLQEYPIEQYIRDAKIDSLYEGTTAIQAQDFFFRKIARDQGVALAHVCGQIQAFIDEESRFATERGLLATALGDLQAMVGALTGYLIASQQDATELYKVGLGSVELLMAFGDLLIGWLLLRQATVAQAALELTPSAADTAFYTGKIAVASFFAAHFLPRLSASRAIVTTLTNDIMLIDDNSF